jgi:hypothetical protein
MPGSTVMSGRDWLGAALGGPLCPIRAQVWLAEALSQHAQHDSGLAFAVFIPVPRRAVRYQLQGRARRGSGSERPWPCITPNLHCRSIGAFAAAECHRTVSYGAVPYGKIESDPQTVLLSANRIQQASQKMSNVQFKILTIPLQPALCS